MDNRKIHRKKFLSGGNYLLGIAGYLAAVVLMVYVGMVAYDHYRKELIAAEQDELLMMAGTIGKSLVNYIEQELDSMDLYCFMLEEDRLAADREYVERLCRAYLEKRGIYMMRPHILTRKAEKPFCMEPWSFRRRCCRTGMGR